MRRTKIIATIGPATAAGDRLHALAEAGMDVARLNFSHGSHATHAEAMAHLREIGKQRDKPLAILQDLCGPKIRLGDLPEEGISVAAGQEVAFVLQAAGDRPEEIPLPNSIVFAMVREGEPISIDDGRIKLITSDRDADTIRATVKIGGTLLSHKGVNLPQTSLPLPSVTDKDLADLRFGIKQGVDWVAVSFVRSARDLESVRRAIEAARSQTRIIAKIEKREAVEEFDRILDTADAIMIARGDLGVEMPLERVPLIQKDIIRRCNSAGKPVITATQMLESMISAPDPTRAEAADVANSILDGTDAVMLSGETAVGKYPVDAVRVMSDIAVEMEQARQQQTWQPLGSPEGSLSVTESVAESVCQIAYETGSRLIICNTTSGGTARLVSKYRPMKPTIAFTPDRVTYQQLALSWGVQPYLIPAATNTEDMLIVTIERAIAQGLVTEGDKVVITSGVPIGTPGSTSLIKVHTIGQSISA
jgi:pyruvate kinase